MAHSFRADERSPARDVGGENLAGLDQVLEPAFPQQRQHTLGGVYNAAFILDSQAQCFQLGRTNYRSTPIRIHINGRIGIGIQVSVQAQWSVDITPERIVPVEAADL